MIARNGRIHSQSPCKKDTEHMNVVPILNRPYFRLQTSTQTVANNDFHLSQRPVLMTKFTLLDFNLSVIYIMLISLFFLWLSANTLCSFNAQWNQPQHLSCMIHVPSISIYNSEYNAWPEAC